MVRFAALVVCGLCFAGCEDRTTTTLGGVHITVDGAPDMIQVIDDTSHVEVGSAKYNLSVQNDRLKVNDQDYGPVSKGDK